MMAKDFGEFSITEPGDNQSAEQRKEAELKKLNQQPRAVLSYVIGGVRMEVSLKDFMDKYGDPSKHDQRTLIKYVMETWMKKNL